MVKIVLSTGQSNTRGRYPGGPPFSQASRVRVWNNVNPLGANGTAFVVPSEGANPFNPDGSSSMPLWFCHRMSQELNDDVRLITVSRDSSDLTFWNPSTGAVYQELIAVYAASGQPAADVLIWHQGESGNGATGELDTVYKQDWLTMRNAMRAAGILKNQAPCIVGGLQGVRIGGARDLNLQQLAAEQPDVYYASSADLDDGGDGLHFSGSALYVFGYFRYWEQYRLHIGPPARKTGAIRLTF